MRVAIVHDWLYTFGGAERVLRSILRCFPNADVFTLFDVLSTADRQAIGLTGARVSFLQKLPRIAQKHRLYLPLMPLAIEQFDLSRYDLVVSSSYAVAKGVLTGPDQLHISYVHSPMRYAWDLQHQYLAESGLTRGIKSALARFLLHKMRLWDSRTANGVDVYVANSHFIGRRVRKIYGRDASVIYPPVRVGAAPPPVQVKEDFFLTASRLVAYKNVRAIVETFNRLPNQRLVIAGSGPELQRLSRLAGSNITFAGFVPDDELQRLMRVTKAFIFAAEEDFGIVPIEAQGEGTPVIALGRGGLRETIIADGPSPTGIFFATPTPDAIASAIENFLSRPEQFTPLACHANAARFSESRFEAEFSTFVHDQYSLFKVRMAMGRNRGLQEQDRQDAPAAVPAPP